jgi:hypothetical protein
MASLSTRAHGIVDYLVAALLVALPWLFGFDRGGAERWIPMSVGAAIACYSLFTDYEFAVLRRVQMPAHLWFDAFAGVFLIASPWLWGFDGRVWIPHVVLGALVLLVATVSQTIPGYERRRTR